MLRRLPALRDLPAFAAMVLPTLAAWLYFVVLAGSAWAMPTYLAAKVVQLAIPIVWLAVHRQRPRLAGPGARRTLVWGLASGAALASSILALHRIGIAGGPLAAALTPRIAAKLADFGGVDPQRYLAIAVGLSLANALFEELYWRWFVYGRLRTLLARPAAMVLASAAFASHHVVIILAYLPEGSGPIAVAAALAIALAGGLWCWLYERSGSLLAPWISHILADAALMAVGYQLLWSG